ncbi:hypothetical protein STRDD10_00814 [Streptococcus sp. DD10]|uniref:hypothetical protein n=1 Tax=Streptococcus sp. DD10 TaxID=1777878 RepID=UPI000799AE0C|nr:hypothetical protein [Streptococcus sp. DD10]KXT74603.1 hypothetical protein STRDD10_00814 [Streptococcus sp. DD10]
MIKKLLAVLLPVFFVFSIVGATTVEADTNQVTVRVDFLEEGTNKKLAESTVVSGNEGAFANISIPQSLVNPYNLTRRDFSAESKQLIANNQIHNKTLVYQIYFSKKANYKPNVISQITAIFSQVTTSQTTISAVVPVTTHVSGSVSVSQTQTITTSSQSSSSTTTIKKENGTNQQNKKSVRRPVGKSLEKAKRYKR